MKLEVRRRLQDDHITYKLAAVLISESEDESKILDQLFGNQVLDSDGLIARRMVEVRLSDGYAEHYVHVLPDTTFDLVQHLERQRAFSEKAFGPGTRTKGVLAHIRKELNEIEAAPEDVSEWIDVVLLALDGAWRAGFTSAEIAAALEAKQGKNERRTWPDWRTASEDAPIEHSRSA